MSLLLWLPQDAAWAEKFGRLKDAADTEAWPLLVELAKARLDFTQTLRLDRALQKRFGKAPPPGLTTRPLRVAILGSSTVDHLLPGLRLGRLAAEPLDFDLHH